MNRFFQFYADARAQAEQRTSPWNILSVALIFIGLLGSCFLIVKYLWGLQQRLFPVDAFLASGTGIGKVLMILPMLFLSVPIGAMFADFIILSIPSARKVFEKELNGAKAGWLMSSMMFYSKVIIIMMLILVPITACGFYNYLYVTPDGVTLRSLPWIPESHYRWSDVDRIHSEYLLKDNEIHWGYVLHMKDGRSVDLLEELGLKFIENYSQIEPFIKAQRGITFDSNIENQAINRARNKSPEFAKKLTRIFKNEY